MLHKTHYRNRETAFYSPPDGDGGMWWSVTPGFSLLLLGARHWLSSLGTIAIGLLAETVHMLIINS